MLGTDVLKVSSTFQVKNSKWQLITSEIQKGSSFENLISSNFHILAKEHLHLATGAP